MKALRPTNIPFPSTGSFTRASTATYIEDGILKTAAVNEPRWQNGQLLVEGAATNLLSASEDFSAASWVRTSVLMQVNATTSPSGTSTADKVVWNTASTFHEVWAAFSSIAGVQYCGSYFVKAAEHRYVQLLGPGAVFAEYANFDLLAGTRTDGSPGFGTIAPVGDGWFRVSLAAIALSGSSTARISIGLIPSATSGRALVAAGDGVSGVYIWGAQLEQSSAATSYIPTTTTAATRAADTIAGTGLIYTSATDARPLWSNATTYSIGQVIRYNNTVYESLQNTNLNKQPDTNPTWWLNLGADNISAAFDGKVGSKTTSTEKLRMIIKPDTNIDSVGYIEATASTISTSAIDEDYNLVYSYKSGLDTSIIEDWYDYFFLDPLGDPLTQVVHQGINPLDPNLVIGVEMVRSGTVELGVFVTGQTTAIGKTQYGLRAGIVDYSKKEADEFGNITIVERPYSKRLEGDVYVNNYDLNKVQRFLYNVRATPILWIASDSEELAEVSNVYGFYKDFSTTIAYPDVSMCSLQIEGLV